MPCSDGCYSAPSVGERKEFARVTEMLCDACQLLEKHSIIFPVSLSVWWLNHKEEDRKRVEREVAENDIRQKREEAIRKLTPYERKLLGL